MAEGAGPGDKRSIRKRILKEDSVTYGENDDLPKLYVGAASR
jgi:hypothetical protein